jgi:hypothetical protein
MLRGMLKSSRQDAGHAADANGDPDLIPVPPDEAGHEDYCAIRPR